jgi:SAM-dependent methyltransferase
MRYPIDVVFLDQDLCVVGVRTALAPWRHAAHRGARFALELHAGESGHRGIAVGDELTLTTASSVRAMNEVRYGDEYFEAHVWLTKRSAEAIVPLVMDLLAPRSVCDVGCGRGVWLSVFREHGVTEVLGMDGDYLDRALLEIDESNFREVDLEQGVPAAGSFDLAMSLEVGEHLPESAAAAFVDGLVALAPAVLFAAAVPGQGGTGHVNERWPDYWRAHFERHEYVPVDCIRPQIWERSEVRPWYRQNTIVFSSRSLIESNERLRAAHERYSGRPLSVVHPGILEAVLERPWNLLQKLTEEVAAGRMDHAEVTDRMARLLRRFAERARANSADRAELREPSGRRPRRAADR